MYGHPVRDSCDDDEAHSEYIRQDLTRGTRAETGYGRPEAAKRKQEHCAGIHPVVGWSLSVAKPSEEGWRYWLQTQNGRLS